MSTPFKPRQFGRYLLTDRIATGGMSEIFIGKAFGPMGFEKKLVIKRILPQYASDEEFLHMFITEAKLVCNLEHPNIVQVYELGEVEGQYYIAMEHVNGIDAHVLWRTLARRRQRLPVMLALHIVSEFLKGLHYAHRATGSDGELLGVVHRDVSPSNIMISYRGDVKIGDFGIALVKHESKSRSGALKGKFGYMTPEQLAGLRVDHRTDIFAAGVVLAELLLGRRLFLGESDFATMHKVLNVRLDILDEHEHALPAEVAWLVRRALQREVADRYQTAEAFQEDIAEYLYQQRARVGSDTLAGFLDDYVIPHLGRTPDEASVPSAPSSAIIRPIPAVEEETTGLRRELQFDPAPQEEAPLAVYGQGFAPVDMTSEAIISPPLGPADFDELSPEEELEPNDPSRDQVAPEQVPDPEMARLLVSGQLAAARAPTREVRPDFHGSLESRTVAKVVFRFVVVSETGLLVLSGPRSTALEAECLARIEALQARYDGARDRSLTERTETRTCQIHLEHGQPNLISADRSEERLAAYLLRLGVLTEEQLAGSIRAYPQLKPIAALVAAGQIVPMQVSRQATAFVLWSVLESFAWTTGAFAFYHGRDPAADAFPSGLQSLEMITRGAAHLDAEALDAYFARLRGRQIVASRTPTVRVEAFNPDELFMDCYLAIIERRPVEEALDTCSLLADPLRVRQALYLMLECDLARLV
jgi:eukaryotic-like serine/threonine-protein kinase